MCTKLNISFSGLKVPKVGVLIVENTNMVLDKENQIKLPGIVGRNLSQLFYYTFIQK